MCILKQAIAIAITVPLLGLGNATIAADESSSTMAGKSWNASVGLKLWRNEWTIPGFGSHQAPEYHSGAELVMIPVLSARYKNWMVSGSYFPKTDYSFNSSGTVNFNQPTFPGVQIDSARVNGERSEFDINVGYYVLPSLIVTLGYKNIDRDFAITHTLSTGDTTSSRANQDTSGFTLGLAAVAPLSDKIGLYGSFAYGLDMETEWGTGFEYDNDYYLGELGLLYGKKLDGVPVLESASAYVGYRFQALIEHYQTSHPFTNSSSVGTNTADYTQGFVIGVNLSF